MSFIRLLLAEMGPARTRLLLSIAISGLAMGWIIVLVNSLADLRLGVPHFQLLGQFALAAVLAVWFRMQALGFTNSVCESMTDRLRRRFVALVGRKKNHAVEWAHLATIETEPYVMPERCRPKPGRSWP